MKSRGGIYPYLLTLPSLLLIFAVTLYPSLYSIYMSLTRSKHGVTEFVGLDNFRRILNTTDFYQSLQATLIFTAFYVLFTITIAYAIALMLNRGLRLTGFYMTIIFLPWVLSEITTGVVWRWMFYPKEGIIQNLIAPLINNIALITRPWGAMIIVIAATVWRSISFAMLLLLAGLQTIPTEITEAAQIDGASGFGVFRYITWPLMLPTVVVTAVFILIQGINGVGMILSITEGGPGRATEVLGIMMYRQAVQYYNFGYAAAIAVLLLIINAILAAFYLRALRQESALAA
ncbi:MAG: sugar ABC transporter permease [Anaerolineales bacterium]|nr:sugar ABC transporter permease [Anaerolineales bacterium]MDW8161980.1 sugar ABC transporter permease [Anaerolineales bacterium]